VEEVHAGLRKHEIPCNKRELERKTQTM